MKISIDKHSRFVVFMVVLTLAMFITPVMAQSASQEPVKVKVLLLPFVSFAPFFIAEEEGYFAEQGLEIEFVKLEGSAAAIPALLMGNLDVVGATIDVGFLNAMAKGGDLKIVADKGYIPSTGCAYLALVARRALVEAGELSTPAQLRGRRFATNPLGTSGYFAEKVLEMGNLTFEDVSVEVVPFSAHLAALEAGAVDVINTGDPTITQLLKSGKGVMWMPANDVVPDFQLAVIFYGPKLVKEHPEVGERFMVGYLKAVRQYNQGKTARNVEIVSKHTNLDPTLLEETCWPPIRDDGQIDIDSVLKFQSWSLNKGLLDSIVPATQFWDDRFIKSANEILGPPAAE